MLHSQCFNNSQKYESCRSSDIQYEIVVFVYLQTARTSALRPMEMLLKLRHIKLQMLKLWRCISANENTRGAERMPVVS